MSAGRLLILAILAFFILSGRYVYPQSNQTEYLTITTYYPAPYGVYRNLRLYPSTQLPPGNSGAQRGTMYYNSTDDQIYYFDGSVWKALVSQDQMALKTVRGDNAVCPADTSEFARKWVPKTCTSPQLCSVCFSGYPCTIQCTTRRSWVYNNSQELIIPYCDYGCMPPGKEKSGSRCVAERWEAVMCLGD